MSSFFGWFGPSKSNPRPQSNPNPPPSEEVNQWRHVNWDERDQIEADLRELTISHPQITHLRILLHGPVGAGKSSFINSANSVFEHRVMTRAGTAWSTSTSLTKRYKSYKFKDGKNGTLPFIFSDVMGLEDDGGIGIHSDDIINIIWGHVKENYVFNPACALRAGEPGYIGNPTLNDKVHCVVSVVSAKTISGMYEAVIRSMKNVREKASDNDIPHVVILTHIDECCPLVKQNLRNVYISRKIQQKMHECRAIWGVSMTNIFPVQNYHEESDTNNDTDILILLALRQILNFANDYVEDL